MWKPGGSSRPTCRRRRSWRPHAPFRKIWWGGWGMAASFVGAMGSRPWAAGLASSAAAAEPRFERDCDLQHASAHACAPSARSCRSPPMRVRSCCECRAFRPSATVAATDASGQGAGRQPLHGPRAARRQLGPAVRRRLAAAESAQVVSTRVAARKTSRSAACRRQSPTARLTGKAAFGACGQRLVRR